MIEDYERDGFVVLRGLLPDEALAPVRDVFAAAVDRLAKDWVAEGFIPDACESEPFERRYAAIRAQHPARSPVSWRRILVSRPVYNLWQRPEILAPIRTLVGDEVFAHGIWNGRPREPHQPIQTINWHQDAHYYKDWDASDGRLVTCWIPLVPVDERNGCLQVIRGSHTRGMAKPIREKTGLFTVDEDATAGDAVSLPMDPGDVLLFSDVTMHRSLHNESDGVRWSIDIRFGQPAPEIMRKTKLGYRCFSASDPSQVESFETWEAKYDYVFPPEFFDPSRSPADLDAIAKRIGVSRSELEVF